MIDDAIFNQVVALIVSHKPVEKVVLFGSRASGRCKDTSDIDIAIFGREWTDTDINLVKDRLEEHIKVPLKFDLVNFYSASKEGLRQNIITYGRLLYDASAAPRNL